MYGNVEGMARTINVAPLNERPLFVFSRKLQDVSKERKRFRARR